MAGTGDQATLLMIAEVVERGDLRIWFKRKERKDRTG
jgi:hypothetical protein